MSYEIRKVQKGYKVCEEDGDKCFSKRPLPKAKAKKQLRALYAAKTTKPKIKMFERMDGSESTNKGRFTARVQKDTSMPLSFSGSKRDVANFIASNTGMDPLMVLKQIHSKNPSTFGTPAVAISFPEKMTGAGLFDWLKNKASQVSGAIKSGISGIINNVENNIANPTTSIGDKFFQEQTKIFSPSGRADDPGIAPQAVIQNFVADPNMPSTKLLYEMNKASYADTTNSVGSWQFISGTPTLRFYKNGNTIVIAVRGTADQRDMITDLTIAAQDMDSQQRFIQDKMEILKFQQQYPTETYTYLLTGHSLGGAICDSLMAAGIGEQAITFNPAVQKRFYDSQNNKRIYQEEDPLYRMMGKYCKYNVEIRKGRVKNAIEQAAQYIPIAGVGYTALQAHSLDNYVGGMWYDKSKEVPMFQRKMLGFTKNESEPDMVGGGITVKPTKNSAGQRVLILKDSFTGTTFTATTFEKLMNFIDSYLKELNIRLLGTRQSLNTHEPMIDKENMGLINDSDYDMKRRRSVINQFDQRLDMQRNMKEQWLHLKTSVVEKAPALKMFLSGPGAPAASAAAATHQVPAVYDEGAPAYDPATRRAPHPMDELFESD